MPKLKVLNLDLKAETPRLHIFFELFHSNNENNRHQWQNQMVGSTLLS